MPYGGLGLVCMLMGSVCRGCVVFWVEGCRRWRGSSVVQWELVHPGISLWEVFGRVCLTIRVEALAFPRPSVPLASRALNWGERKYCVWSRFGFKFGFRFRFGGLFVVCLTRRWDWVLTGTRLWYFSSCLYSTSRVSLHALCKLWKSPGMHASGLFRESTTEVCQALSSTINCFTWREPWSS